MSWTMSRAGSLLEVRRRGDGERLHAHPAQHAGDPAAEGRQARQARGADDPAAEGRLLQPSGESESGHGSLVLLLFECGESWFMQ